MHKYFWAVINVFWDLPNLTLEEHRFYKIYINDHKLFGELIWIWHILQQEAHLLILQCKM